MNEKRQLMIWRTVAIAALCLLLVVSVLYALGVGWRQEAPAQPEATAAPQAQEDLLTQIQARGTLVIATEGNWAPWTYHDESGKLVGLDVEIGQLLAAGLQVEAGFQETDWDAILAGVDSGRFDIACNGVGYNPKRAEKYDFSTPYVYTHKVLVVAADNEDIHTVDDLQGRTTANSASSTYAQLAEEKGATVTYVSTLGETMELLVHGRVDATINAQVSIEDYLNQHPEDREKVKIVQVLPGDPVAFPVRKGPGSAALLARINEILEQARQDGTLAAISIKYFGLDLTRPD